MTTQYGFFIDSSRCTGCKTCELACKDFKVESAVSFGPFRASRHHILWWHFSKKAKGGHHDHSTHPCV